MMNRADSTIATQLENEYCPPLDVPLVRSIISDYDITQPDDLNAVRTLLEELRGAAAIEVATEFVPSGSGGYYPLDEHDIEHTSSATDTTNTSGSGDQSSCRPGSELKHEHAKLPQEIQSLHVDEKGEILKAMFPAEDPQKVDFILKKCQGNMERAMDELLNHVFFEECTDEDKIITKGVDAFFENSHIPQKRRKDKANKAKFLRDVAANDLESKVLSGHLKSPNKWVNASKDVEFIASRTQIPVNTISSLYHESGASLSNTIGLLLERQSAISPEDLPADDIANAIQLRADFPALSMAHAISLIFIAQPSTSNAHQLAKAFVNRGGPSSGTTRGGIEIIPNYIEPVLPSGSDNVTLKENKSPAVSHLGTMSREHLMAAREQAFKNASTAYRRGKSDRLHGGVATHYAEVGRIYNQALHEATSADADGLVSTQSGVDYCDLHGVSVRDGSRIACAKVEKWWDRLGEGSLKGNHWQGGQGYRIIVGVGRHSKDGKSRLGPAVAKRLMAEGWKVEMAGGEIYVKSKSSRT